MNKKTIIAIIISLVVISAIVSIILINSNKTYEITFDSNGGTIVESQIVKKGNQVARPNNPTKDGYIFISWTYQNQTYDFSSEVKSNLILTAKWQEVKKDVETFIVEFDSDGGTTIANQVIEKEKTVKKPKDPTKEKYIFKGWFLDDKEYDFTNKVDKNIMLKAKWEEEQKEEKKQESPTKKDKEKTTSDSTTKTTKNTYTVSFNSNGGSSVSSVKVTEGNKIAKPSNPTKESYVFIEWTLNGKSYNFSTAVNSNITLVANWHLLGDVNSDGIINTLDAVIISKYIKGGYEMPAGFKVAYGDVNTDGVIDDVDTTILAQYIADGCKYDPKGYGIKLPYNSGAKYSISYNLNGGKTAQNNISKYAAVSLPFNLENPTKEGYIFMGWTGSNGETPQKDLTIPKGTTGNLNYIANWHLLGDVNSDGIINSLDAVIISRYIKGGYEMPAGFKVAYGDVNTDGVIDDVDTTILAQYIADGCKYDPKGYGIKLPYNSGAKYSISYNLNGGKTAQNNISKYAAVSLPFNLENPTKEGYIFMGWTGSNGETPQKDLTIPKGTTGNLTYIANWQAN